MEHMQIRMATMEDLDEIAFVESECFLLRRRRQKKNLQRELKNMEPILADV